MRPEFNELFDELCEFLSGGGSAYPARHESHSEWAVTQVRNFQKHYPYQETCSVCRRAMIAGQWHEHAAE
jgi:hypothetical protein